MLPNTISYLQNLIILENSFCINRSYLLDGPKLRIVCNVISVASFTITAFILSYILYSEDVNIRTRCFHVFMGLELLVLTLGARIRRGSFEMITKLDEKYGVYDKYFAEIKRQVTRIIVLLVSTILLDMASMYLLKVQYGLIVLSCVMISAHETEMAVFALLVQCVNIRLSKLFDVTPKLGSKIYRHVLIAASHLNEEFSLRLLIMYGISIATTVIYAMVVILSEARMISQLTVYLIWREFKTIYSVWMACAAAAKTEVICSQLTFHLAERMVFDRTVSKDKNSSQHKALVRWYNALLTQRPQYIHGTILSMGLGVPLQLLNLSINYLLIIVQIYLAYQ